MIYFVVLLIVGVIAYIQRDRLLGLLKRPPVSVSVPVQAPAPVQAPTGAQGPVAPVDTVPSSPFQDAYKQSNPQQADTSGVTGDSNFIPQPTMTFAEARGQNLPAEGSTNYKITHIPGKLRVMALQQAGSFASAFTLSVNGQSQHQDNPMSLTTITVDGPEAEISVVQDGNSHLTVQVQEG